MVFNSSYWEYLLFVNSWKNLKKWKKHSVLIIFPCHSLNQNSSTSDLSFSQVTSVEKREPRKHFSASACSFLGLGLRSRPQKSGFGFEKLFLSSLFSTLVTWEKLKSDKDKFLPKKVASTILETECFFHLSGFFVDSKSQNIGFEWPKVLNVLKSHIILW